ncbi:O-antigen translocase [Vogesella sp. GCM10023246]|uniref:O-antigen translocase n=1 Tax=Vogesella oryzagri TaxID=3160864 RepID=A0ABV1M8P0_9NEIS
MKKLLSVTFFSGLLTLLRMSCGFVIAKVVAVQTGPAGIAMLGQVQGFVGALTSVVSAPVSNGVVRYTAANQALGHEFCAPWWRASIHWLIVMLILAIPLVCAFSYQLSGLLFSTYQYNWVIILAGCVLPLAGLSTLFTSVLNGMQNYRRYVISGMISVVCSTILMLILIWSYATSGALAAAAVTSAVSGAVLLLLVRHEPWMHRRLWFGRPDMRKFREIGAYVAMAVTSSICGPLSLILARRFLVDHSGWDTAGQWQAVYKISEVYLGVITVALSTYYLPKLSSLSTPDEIKREIWVTGRLIVPLVALAGLLIYLSREWIIVSLFTKDFRPASNLFAVQLTGDVIKIASWLVAYPMISRGAVKWFIGSELVFSSTFVFFSYILATQFNAIGVCIAYTINYTLYFIFVSLNLKRFYI